MALDASHLAKISRNFGYSLSILNLWSKTQVFLCGAPRHLARGFARDLLFRKTQHFWISHGNIWIPSHGQEILTGFKLPKRSKTPQKWPFCPFLDTQEEVLGELSFGGENGGQIQSLHFVLECRQVDLYNKPTWSKFGHWEISVAHWRNFAQFDQNTLFFA